VPLGGPFVVLFGEDGPDEAGERVVSVRSAMSLAHRNRLCRIRKG